MPLTTPNYCPCGSALAGARCCARFINQGQIPATALELMRSRYTAHVCGAIDYLWLSWSETTRQDTTKEAIAEWAASCDWLGLEILNCQAGGPGDTEGTVTFCATYRLDRRLHQHLEKSLFRREQNLWRYVGHCN